MIRFESVVLAVKDIGLSTRFYSELFGLVVEFDFGRNVAFQGGLALQQDFDWLTGVSAATVATRPHNMELYFETDDLDAFLSRLEAYPTVEFLHGVRMHDWKQRVVRIYDPDRHLVEIAESMVVVAKRYLAQGYSVEETAALIQHPVTFVEQCREII